MSDRPTILYIDDEPINVRLFEINCRKNYNVLTGLSGNEGLDILKDNPEVQAIFSDLKMPMMNGLEFISKAKQEYPNKLFYIVTGFDLTPEIAEALDAKIIEKYFSKPLQITEIEHTLSNSL